MRKKKTEILKLIDDKINTFESLLSEATYQNRYGEEYFLVYESTQNLILELYSDVNGGLLFPTFVGLKFPTLRYKITPPHT